MREEGKTLGCSRSFALSFLQCPSSVSPVVWSRSAAAPRAITAPAVPRELTFTAVGALVPSWWKRRALCGSGSSPHTQSYSSPHIWGHSRKRLEMDRELDSGVGTLGDAQRWDSLGALGRGLAWLLVPLRGPLGGICTSSNISSGKQMLNDDKVATCVNDILTRTRKMTKFQTCFPSLQRPGTNYLCGNCDCQLRMHELKQGWKKSFLASAFLDMSSCHPTNTMSQSQGIQNSLESLMETGIKSQVTGNSYHNKLTHIWTFNL